MPRSKEVLSPGYQRRLLDLVRQCRQRGDKMISLNQMCRELGNLSLASRFSLWNTVTLKSPVQKDNFELLSKVDPQGRSAQELKEWVESGTDDISDDFLDIAVDDLPALEQSSLGQPSDVIRMFLNLMSGNRPVHHMVEQALMRHGYALNDDGIKFFIEHTSAIRDERKMLVKRYLKGYDIASDAMVIVYPCIATALNRLSGLPISIKGHDLEWLDCEPQNNNKAPVEHK